MPCVVPCTSHRLMSDVSLHPSHPPYLASRAVCSPADLPNLTVTSPQRLSPSQFMSSSWPSEMDTSLLDSPRRRKSLANRKSLAFSSNGAKPEGDEKRTIELSEEAMAKVQQRNLKAKDAYGLAAREMMNNAETVFKFMNENFHKAGAAIDTMSTIYGLEVDETGRMVDHVMETVTSAAGAEDSSNKRSEMDAEDSRNKRKNKNGWDAVGASTLVKDLSKIVCKDIKDTGDMDPSFKKLMAMAVGDGGPNAMLVNQLSVGTDMSLTLDKTRISAFPKVIKSQAPPPKSTTGPFFTLDVDSFSTATFCPNFQLLREQYGVMTQDAVGEKDKFKQKNFQSVLSSLKVDTSGPAVPKPMFKSDLPSTSSPSTSSLAEKTFTGDQASSANQDEEKFVKDEVISEAAATDIQYSLPLVLPTSPIQIPSYVPEGGDDDGYNEYEAGEGGGGDDDEPYYSDDDRKEIVTSKQDLLQFYTAQLENAENPSFKDFVNAKRAAAYPNRYVDAATAAEARGKKKAKVSKPKEEKKTIDFRGCKLNAKVVFQKATKSLSLPKKPRALQSRLNATGLAARMSGASKDKFVETDLCNMFFRPKLMFKPIKLENGAIGTASSTELQEQFTPSSPMMDYDAGEGGGNGNYFGDDDDEDGMDDDDNSFMSCVEPAMDVVRPAHNIGNVRVPFATRAKKVDVKRLKLDLWKKIEVLSSTTSSKKSANPETKNSTTLTTSIRELSENFNENVTVPFYFICMLHLANENGLVLKNVGDEFADVRIQTVAPAS